MTVAGLVTEIEPMFTTWNRIELTQSSCGMSQLPDILAYFQHSCPAPIYFVYSSVSIYQTFTRFIRQCLLDWLFPHLRMYVKIQSTALLLSCSILMCLMTLNNTLYLLRITKSSYHDFELIVNVNRL